MSRTLSDPETERIIKAVLNWLTVRAKENARFSSDWIVSLEVDADHSSLLARLLKGKEPLEHAPPLAFSYPWYSLIEEGFGILNARFCHYHKPGEGGVLRGEYWNLEQSIWWVTGRDGETFFLKHAYGWTAQLDPAEATVHYIKTGEEKKEPGYRLTITGWKEPDSE